MPADPPLANLVFAAAEATARGANRGLAANAVASLLFLACLFWLANFPASANRNPVMKVATRTHYIADLVGPLPGAGLVIAAASFGYLAARRASAVVTS